MRLIILQNRMQHYSTVFVSLQYILLFGILGAHIAPDFLLASALKTNELDNTVINIGPRILFMTHAQSQRNV